MKVSKTDIAKNYKPAIILGGDSVKHISKARAIVGNSLHYSGAELSKDVAEHGPLVPLALALVYTLTEINLEQTAPYSYSCRNALVITVLL